MKKWLALVLILLALLAGYIAAGPFLTINAIRQAVAEQDAAELSRHIDFPALRASFRRQFDDYLVRRAGQDVQSSMLGALALRMASGASGPLVDAMATPAGLAAGLEGRNLLHRLQGARQPGGSGATPPRDPLDGAEYRYESPSRFTATITDADGEPVVFVLTRTGLRWKVSDVRLPLPGMDEPDDLTLE